MHAPALLCSQGETTRACMLKPASSPSQIMSLSASCSWGGVDGVSASYNLRLRHCPALRHIAFSPRLERDESKPEHQNSTSKQSYPQSCRQSRERASCGSSGRGDTFHRSSSSSCRLPAPAQTISRVALTRTLSNGRPPVPLLLPPPSPPAM